MLQEPFSRCCPKALAGNVGTRLSACWKRMWPGLEKHSGLKFIIFPLFRQEDLVELLFIPSEGNNWGWAKVLLTRLLGSNGGTAQSPKHCDYTVGFTILRTLPGRIILRQFLRWGYAPFPFWFGHVSIPGITINHWVFVGRNQGSGASIMFHHCSSVFIIFHHCSSLFIIVHLFLVGVSPWQWVKIVHWMCEAHILIFLVHVQSQSRTNRPWFIHCWCMLVQLPCNVIVMC